VRCTRCGNENPGTNRFCGMCGAILLPQSAAASAPNPRAATAAPASPSATAAALPTPPAPASSPQNATAPRTAAPVSDVRPTISGPSFLGLNDPPPRKRASLSIDPDSLGPASSDSQSAASSSNLDYLLEDEEEPRSGVGKYILIFLALALVAGLGYMRWKNESFGWLNSSPSKPAAAAQPSDAGDSSTPAPSSTAPNSTAPNTSAAPGSNQPAADSPATPSTPSGSAVPGTATPSPAAAAPVTASPSAATQPAAKDSDADGSDTPPTSAPKPKPVTVDASAKPTPVRTGDAVSEAQKYLYGKGVRQDCDRGMRLLKPAADRANPKAMIEMGALYSAGLCAPHDLPTAYRWFALALRKDPDNQSVQTDLQKLWGEMTQPERQLAIKLSQ
jgi:hypothetical protein